MEIWQFIYILLLALGTMLLYILPFIPAMIEWRTKADSEPFVVNFQDRSLVDYGIRLFREYINQHFSSLLEQYQTIEQQSTGQNEKGIHYFISGNPGLITLPKKDSQQGSSHSVILLCNASILPANVHFTNKLYAKKSLITGEQNKLSEVMVEGDIQINKNNLVSKLLLSETSIDIAEGCRLKGYVRAKEAIRLSQNIEFQYLYAESIAFGEVQDDLPQSAVDVFSDAIQRHISNEPMIIPAGTQQTQHWVVKAPLVIENNCTLTGNIKCTRHIRIADHSIIFGAIICESSIDIGENCYIQGPIVANEAINIGKNCKIGTKSAKTSVIANKLVIAEGCLIAGLVLAKNQGLIR